LHRGSPSNSPKVARPLRQRGRETVGGIEATEGEIVAEKGLESDRHLALRRPSACREQSGKTKTLGQTTHVNLVEMVSVV
jgi:hypothetical protein